MDSSGTRARRPRLRLVIPAAAAAGCTLLATACRTSPAPTLVSTAQPKTNQAPVPTDSRAGALAYGRKLLASLHLPLLAEIKRLLRG